MNARPNINPNRCFLDSLLASQFENDFQSRDFGDFGFRRNFGDTDGTHHLVREIL